MHLDVTQEEEWILESQDWEKCVMVERIIGLISCLLCAVPFLIISIYDKDGIEPIDFWSGDKTLKQKVTNVPEYNKEMANLYKKCAIVFVLTGIGFMVAPVVGIIMLGFDCTVGIYIVYRGYKKILGKYE